MKRSIQLLYPGPDKTRTEDLPFVMHQAVLGVREGLSDVLEAYATDLSWDVEYIVRNVMLGRAATLKLSPWMQFFWVLRTTGTGIADSLDDESIQYWVNSESFRALLRIYVTIPDDKGVERCLRARAEVMRVAVSEVAS